MTIVWRLKWLIIISLIFMLGMCAGCGAPKMYFETGVGYKFNADQVLLPKYNGGRNPTFHLEVGLIWKDRYQCGLNHWSHVRDGGPFNNRPETYKDELVCSVRFQEK